MKYRELTLHVHKDAVDVVCAMLYNYPIQGVEIKDFFLTDEDKKEMFVDMMGIDNPQLEELPVKFYISYEDDIAEILASIQEELEEMSEYMTLGSLKLETGESDEEDWAHNWKAYYKPFMIGNRILVKPIWETIDTDSEFGKAEIVIEIDPGMAFGSGTHETTSMCIKALDKYLKPTDTLIDLGCGSGILGIAGIKLGAEHATLIDLDLSAIKIAKENCESNKVTDSVTVIHGDLLENVSDVVDVVVANIFADIIIGVTDDVKKVLKKDGLFISSGIIIERLEDVLSKLESSGFEVIEILKESGWVAIVCHNV